MDRAASHLVLLIVLSVFIGFVFVRSAGAVMPSEWSALVSFRHSLAICLGSMK